MRNNLLQGLFTLILLSVTMPVHSQSEYKMVYGKVVNSENIPITGAHVSLKSGYDSTETDAEGNYRIQAKPTDTLLVRYVAYTPQRIDVGSKTTINVTLQKKSNLMAEDVIKKYAGYTAYDFFYKRCDTNDQKANALQLRSLDENYLGFPLPESYQNFVNNYILGEEPYLFHLNLTAEESDLFEFHFISSFNDKGEWTANYHYFLTFKETYQFWGLFGRQYQEEYNWNLIQIEEHFYGNGSGLYLGYGPDNAGKIYRLLPEFIPADFKYDPKEKYKFNYIRFVADDIFQFVEGLRFNFDVNVTDGN